MGGRLPVKLFSASAQFIVVVVSLFAIADEIPTAWQLLDDGDPDPGRLSLGFDPERQVVVGIQGASGMDGFAFAWELHGNDWKRRFSGLPAPIGIWECAAFDSHRGVMVLTLGDERAETWEWNGISWTQKVTSSHPSTRVGAGMVFDSQRGVMVLFGGYSNDAFLGDTWEYDGVDWVQRTLPFRPTSRSDMGMAYDSGRGFVILFGGENSGGALRDTWEYDGVTWWKRTPATPLPAPRRRSEMVYDPIRQRTVMFGGLGSSTELGDTWLWNGTKWERKTPSVSPGARWWFRMAFDAARGKVVGFGGDYNDASRNDTWTWDGITWEQIAISNLPLPRVSPAFAWNDQEKQAVLYGGSSETVPLDYRLWDTWHLKDLLWKFQDGVGQPTASYGFGLVFDPHGQRFVGFSGSILLTDIHSYAGPPPGWDSFSPGSVTPSGRKHHGWVWAEALGGAFLFGGKPSGAYTEDDSWLLQGDQWREYDPLTRPRPRELMAMAYDAHRDRVLVYGGYDGYPNVEKYSDTWAFDGTNWIQLDAAGAPGPRSGTTMAYDRSRDRMVLYGNGPAFEGLTWEFDGQNWIARSTPFQPDSNRDFGQSVYADVFGVILFFGGEMSGHEIRFNDLWAYGPDPDGDGIVGLLDNCIDLANTDQTDGDGDKSGDLCDCRPEDAGLWAIPGDVAGLIIGPDRQTLSWPAGSGGTASNTLYDVMRGANPRTPVGVGVEQCLATDLTDLILLDPEVPSPGSAFRYLVRARNSCGTGTWGRASSGTERISAVCP